MNTMIPKANQIDRMNAPKHPVMGMIGATWSNFGAGKSAIQKEQMISVWEKMLSDIPVPLQLEAIKRKAQSGQVWPPGSPAEIRKWCDEVQLPMNEMDVARFQTGIETGVMDADFCRRQIEKFRAAQASGRSVYAGWD